MDKRAEVEARVRAIVNRAHGFDNEGDVKRVTRRILRHTSAFHFMPPSNAYSKVGISDILVVLNGRFVAIETKYGYNKPTAQQDDFGDNVMKAGGLYLVVNEKNIVDQLVRCIAFAYDL